MGSESSRLRRWWIYIIANREDEVSMDSMREQDEYWKLASDANSVLRHAVTAETKSEYRILIIIQQ